MKKLQLGIMAIASIAGVGIASSGFTAKHKFATITVYAFKNANGTFSYFTQTSQIPITATCKSSSETCTLTTTLSLSRLNDNTATPNYTTQFPAEVTGAGQHPYVNYLSPNLVYKN